MEIMVVVGILGIAMMIALPNMFKARDTAQNKICISNLRLIDRVKQQWAFENNQGEATTPAYSDIRPYLPDQALNSYCPASGLYLIRPLNRDPLCTLWRRGHLIVN